MAKKQVKATEAHIDGISVYPVLSQWMVECEGCGWRVLVTRGKRHALGLGEKHECPSG